jgi:hypothetical protein
VREDEFIATKVRSRSKVDFMWHIRYRGLTLQEVLIMAYMNALEAVETLSFARAIYR